jgi:hypothetical protein
MFEIKAVYLTATHVVHYASTVRYASTVHYASTSVWCTVSQKSDDVSFEFHIKQGLYQIIWNNSNSFDDI